jgi:nicotinate-nucleotide adenylyltransferase
MEKKIGLFFGSFNPTHTGHLIMANTVLDTANLDEVWFVISPMSPDKTNDDLLHHDVRAELLRGAIDGETKLFVSTVEFDMEQPNLTYKTLDRLRERHPTYDFSVIMGSDNVNSLQQWVGIEHWMDHHKLLVVNRPSNYLEYGSLRWYGAGRYQIIETPEIGISATMIREKVRKGESIKYLTPTNIINKIEQHYGTKKDSKET